MEASSSGQTHRLNALEALGLVERRLQDDGVVVLLFLVVTCDADLTQS